MAVRPIPEGHHTVTPYIISDDAEALLGFLKQAFGATERDLMRDPKGRIWHAEVTVGDSCIMLGQANDRFHALPAMIHLYVPDTDATYQAALAAGAATIMEPENQFYGDRSAGVRDPTGNFWWIGTHVEDVPPDEMARRAEEAARQRE